MDRHLVFARVACQRPTLQGQADARTERRRRGFAVIGTSKDRHVGALERFGRTWGLDHGGGR
jgi:hypothetical protein